MLNLFHTLKKSVQVIIESKTSVLVSITILKLSAQQKS